MVKYFELSTVSKTNAMYNEVKSQIANNVDFIQNDILKAKEYNNKDSFITILSGLILKNHKEHLHKLLEKEEYTDDGTKI